MNDSLLERLANRKLDPDLAGSEEPDATDDLGAFGWLRGIRDRAIMLEFRMKDGSVTALSYAWLERADYDPSEGITLHFGGKQARIVGRNLAREARPNVRLFAGIVRNRVTWIQEADEAAAMSAPQGATVVERLEI